MMQAGRSCAALAFAVLAGCAAAAEPIKIGVVAVNAFAPVYVAQERGYFAAEGVPASSSISTRPPPSPWPRSPAPSISAVAAVTGAFYNLAGEGELKIIAAAAHEEPGFQLQAISPRATPATPG